MTEPAQWRQRTLAGIGLVWISLQITVLFYPQMPLVDRPVHLAIALLTLLLTRPLGSPSKLAFLSRTIDATLTLAVTGVLLYYLTQGTRLTERMEGIDDVLRIDRLAGAVLLITLFEGVRRLIGWMLLLILGSFIAFAFVGQWYPGWTELAWLPELFRYNGMSADEFFEGLTMTANGLLGITTSTSVGLVFYFVMFGALYSAIGGGQFFIDIGLRIAGGKPGGAAKAAVISSSLMGSISGSAVANVASTGLFTIPLMRKTGSTPTRAAGIESIASTGGQLMPPVMGIAAFVMAELLQIPYKDIVLAAAIPALAFYLSLFFIVHFGSQTANLSGLANPANASPPGLMTRWHLILPPGILVALLLAGWSAPMSALAGCGACFVSSLFHRKTWLRVTDWFQAFGKTAEQAAAVAIPIASIGLIIEIAIQSNLALKFSTDLIALSGGHLPAALALVVVGCLVMGMGLPTVAAYIIGSILFVPALIDLGIPELAAHLFVMYYCVLSMVTPPVALASYTAAGLAQANAFMTSLYAFRLSWVAFLIPFAFVYQPALLADAPWSRVLAASVVIFVAVWGWAAALEGTAGAPLSWPRRLVIAVLSLSLFLLPAATAWHGKLPEILGVPFLWFGWSLVTGFLIVILSTAKVASDGSS